MRNRLAALAARSGAALRWATLAPAVALMAHPAWAALPEVEVPTEGVGGSTCSESNFMCIYGAYVKVGLSMVGIILAGWFFILVVLGAMAKWKTYGDGRATIGDIKEYMCMGAVISAVIVFLVWYSAKILA